MNYLYLANATQQPVTRSYVFNKKNARIDWRQIAAVDVERVAREMDFQVLQENIEQIALCQIDAEVNSRAMDPNYIKLYKMAQLIIEYLLLCQEQITAQLVDYETIKSGGLQEQGELRRQFDKLKNDYNEVKKESKKRKKLIETQQKMLMAQQPNYHTCTICAHKFINGDFLQAHMHRRHGDLDPNRRREHDVDMEKEIQRLRDELKAKENDMQVMKVQKGADEEKIRERDDAIRQLKDDIQAITTKLTILEEKYFTLRSSNPNQSPSPQRRDAGVKELLKESKNLRADNEQLRQLLQQADANGKKEEKAKRRCEREIENLRREISTLTENLQALQNASGDSSRLSQELVTYRNRYNEEKMLRKQVQDELEQANNRLAQFLDQPPPIHDRKSPVPPPRSGVSPSPSIIPAPEIRPAPARSSDPVELHLPNYCPSLVRRLNETPQYLNRFHDDARKNFAEEFEQYDDLGIRETDTRLSNEDYPAKMRIIMETRRLIGRDLANFEGIRADVERTADRLAHERIHNPRPHTSPNRAANAKLVTFQDESRSAPTKRPTTAVTSKPASKYPPPAIPDQSDDEDKSNTYSNSSNNGAYSQSTGARKDQEIRPSPRQHLPSSGVSSLASGSMRPTTSHGSNAGAMLVRPKSTLVRNEFDSDNDDAPIASPSIKVGPGSNVATKVNIIDGKLTDSMAKGHKPTVNAVAQGFQPSRQTLATQDDENSDSSLTSVEDIDPVQKPGSSRSAHNTNREATHDHHRPSLGDASQYTYDSLWKPSAGRGTESKRPQTGDSTKTSNIDSNDELEDEQSD